MFIDPKTNVFLIFRCFICYVLNHVPVAGQISSVLVTPLAFGSFLLFAEHDRIHGKADFAAIRKLAPFAPQLVMVGLISKVLISIGLFLLLLPGIYLAVIWNLAHFFVVLEGKTFWEAMEASRGLHRRALRRGLGGPSGC